MRDRHDVGDLTERGERGERFRQPGLDAGRVEREMAVGLDPDVRPGPPLDQPAVGAP